MISRTDIQRFVDQVVERLQPTRVILFGSHAHGNPNADSDVDLMMVMPHRGSSVEAATRIRLKCPRDFPMDLIVRSPAEVRRRLKKGDLFLREITSKGIVPHEASNARVSR